MLVRNQIFQKALLNNELAIRLAKYSFEDWLFYANQYPVIFQFKYADNEENRRKDRVGRVSGFRQGVRNLKYIPQGSWPVSFNPDLRTYRYWDLGRNQWRSFRHGDFIQVTAFWSESLKKFVDTPEEVSESGLKSPKTRLNKGKEFMSLTEKRALRNVSIRNNTRA